MQPSIFHFSLATAPQFPGFSVMLFLELLLIFAVSVWIYWVLSRRATTRRHWAALSDWAGEHRFRLVDPEAMEDKIQNQIEKKLLGLPELPRVLANLTTPAPTVGYFMTGNPVTRNPLPGGTMDGAMNGTPAHGDPIRKRIWKWLKWIFTLPTPKRSSGSASRVMIFQMDTPRDEASSRRARWHILTRELPQSWPPTGLRPVGHDSSLLDFFALTSFPSLGSSQRFVMFGTEISAARVLAQSSVRALLPADIGLLLHGNLMLLDFSARPFDPLELSRAIELSAQLARALGEPQ